MTAKTDSNPKFYTYVHRKADTGEVFYVGKGCGIRAHNRSSRTEYWKRCAKKHGVVVSIVEYFDCESDAMGAEIQLIAELRSRGAVLVNLTDGGEGTCGRVVSASTKLLMSEKMRGKSSLSPEAIARMAATKRGKKQSPESIAKTAAANRGRKKNPDAVRAGAEKITGVALSEAHKQKLKEAWVLKKQKPNWHEVRAAMSKGHLGKKQSAETIAKRVAKITGRKMTDEQRLALSKRVREYWATKKAAQI